MKKLNLPKSLKKFIRLEKARIRRQVFNPKERKGLIDALYQKIIQKPVLAQPVEAEKNQPTIKAKEKSRAKK